MELGKERRVEYGVLQRQESLGWVSDLVPDASSVPWRGYLFLLVDLLVRHR